VYRIAEKVAVQLGVSEFWLQILESSMAVTGKASALPVIRFWAVTKVLKLTRDANDPEQGLFGMN